MNEIIIKGEISDKEGDGLFTVVNLLDQLSKHEGDTIYLKIDSPGGYVEEADKMKDILLNAKKNIVSENIGNVASAATSLFLLGSPRYYYPERGVFLIHNSWVDGVKGDGDALETIADELRKIDERYDKEIARITGKDVELIRQYSKLDTPLTAEQVSNLNLAEIKYDFKAVAKFKLNNNNQKMELKTELEKFEKSIIQKLADFLKPKAKNLLLVDVNGVEIDFPDISDISELVVGESVSAENGSYTLPDGTVITVEGGKVSEIITPTSDEVEQLKNEIEELKAKLESESQEKQLIDEELKEARNLVSETKQDMEKFKAKMTAFIPKPADSPKEKEKKSFTYKK